MATPKTEVSLEVLVQAAEGAKTVGELKKAMKELQNAALQAGNEGKAALEKSFIKAAAEAKDKIGDLNQAIKNTSSDTRKLDGVVQVTQGIAGGFAAAQGAAALFGKSGKKLEETLLKVQAATALATGVQQIGNIIQKESAASMLILSTATSAYSLVVGTATGAMKLFRIAMAATGIGLIVVGVVALVENFDKLKTALANILPAPVLAAFTFVKDAIGGIVDKVKSWVGLGPEIKGTGNLFSGFMEKFKTVNEEGKKALGALVEKQKEHQEYLKKLSEAGQPGSIGYYNFLLSESNNQLTKLTPGTNSYNTALKQQIQLTNDLAAATEAARIAKVNAERKDTDIAPIKSGIVNELKEAPEVKLEQRKQDAIGDKIKKGVAERNRIYKLERDFRVNTTADTLAVISNLTSLFAGKTLAQQKRAFIINKQLAAAQALVSTYQSATAAYASQLAIPSIDAPVRAAIAAGVAIAGGLVNVAKIESQKFEGGQSTGDSGYKAPADISSLSSGNTGAPNTNLNIPTQSNVPPPVKVYVTETDISSSIKKIGTTEQRALIL